MQVERQGGNSGEDDGDGKGVVGRGVQESRSECGQINRRPSKTGCGRQEEDGLKDYSKVFWPEDASKGGVVGHYGWGRAAEASANNSTLVGYQ